MIFSLLKIRKKTASVLGGVIIALACLWGLALWQDLTPRQLLNLFLGSALLVLAMGLAAGLLVAVLKGIGRLLSRWRQPHDGHSTSNDSQGQ